MGASPGRVLAFDSGIGGLGVVQALRDHLPPGTRIDYLADNALFPYGEQPDAQLIARLDDLIGAQIAERQPDVVVIACNTASTLALTPLRERFRTPFVGCVPPVRWAARVSQSRVIGILATKATVSRPYLKMLHDDYAADCKLIAHGARGLADLAERAFLDESITDAQIMTELDCLFGQPQGDRIDAVGLGCTHYTFLKDAFVRLSPPGVAWLDPASAVARQAALILSRQNPLGDDLGEEMRLTAPPPHADALQRAIRRVGYDRMHVLDNARAQCTRLTV